MSYYPHTRLHAGPSSSVVVSGPYIQLVNNSTGHIVNTADEDITVKSGSVRCSTVDAKWKVVVTVADDKKLRVWDLGDGLTMLSERELPKRPTEIRITQDSEAILVSDKFGDVFRYPMTPNPEATPASRAQEAGKSALASHENLAGGTLVLGHASLLPSFLLSLDEKYIITADRDEHIRVSWYPQGYVIERYCLGHTKFVSAIHIPVFSPGSLISGGGDSYLQFWDWMSGTKGVALPVLDVVYPFLKVRPPKGRPWSSGDVEDVEGAAGNERPGRKKGKGKRRKGKVPNEETTVEVERGAKDVDGEAVEDVVMDTIAIGDDLVTSAEPPSSAIEEDSPVLVINRIEAVLSPDDSKWVLFYAVGATALFYFRYPDDEVTGTDLPPVLHLDFGKPVIDFVPVNNGNIWVLTDGEWVESSETGSEVKPGVRLVHWEEGQSGWNLGEVADTMPLVKSLNSSCLRTATPAQLKAADIYSYLSSMPKNVDPEHDPIVRDDLASLDPAVLTEEIVESTSRKGKGKGKIKSQLTQRELARLKNKKALVESIRQKETGKGDTPEVTEDERDAKKVKPQIAASQQNEVGMDES